MSQPLLITSLGVCKHLDRWFQHTADCYRFVRSQGYDAIILGYLDQWDENLSMLEFYGRSDAIPGLIPQDWLAANRTELSRRLGLAADAGLQVFLSVTGPLGPKCKWTLDNREPMQSGGSYPGGFVNDPKATFGEILGPEGELCLSHPTVRRFFREVMADIVDSFPSIAGFSFFGGDFYSSVCRSGRCPRCGDSSEWRRYLDWVQELGTVARARRPDMRLLLRSWPWWDETFDLLRHCDPSYEFLITPCWGYAFGSEAHQYPALHEPWWMYDINSWLSPTPRGPVFGSAVELTQQWGTVAAVGPKAKRFIAEAKAKGCKLHFWDEVTTNEVLLPHFVPTPHIVFDKMHLANEYGVAGIEDWWGVHRAEAEGRRVNVNRCAVALYRREPDLDRMAFMERLAEQAAASARADLLVAWQAIDDSLRSWAIVSWHQRMNWPIAMWQDAFYVRNLTQPPARAEKSEQNVCTVAFWQALHCNLTTVLGHANRAVTAYEQAAARDPDLAFHRDCVRLYRCIQQVGQYSCLAHIAALGGPAIVRPTLTAAADNLANLIALADALDVFTYRRDWYTDAIAAMRRASRT